MFLINTGRLLERIDDVEQGELNLGDQNPMPQKLTCTAVKCLGKEFYLEAVRFG